MLEVSLITCVVLSLKVACVTPNQMIHRLSYYASWHLSIEVNPLPLGEQGVLIMQIVVGIQACRYLFVFVGYFAPMSMKMSGNVLDHSLNLRKDIVSYKSTIQHANLSQPTMTTRQATAKTAKVE